MKIKKVFTAGVVVAITLCMVGVLPGTPVAAACTTPLPSDKGQAQATATVERAGEYTIWLRMLSPAADRDSAVIQVDDQCPVVVGDAAAHTDFIWVNYQTGDPARPIRLNLGAGAHTITLAGREAGAGFDKLMLVSDPTCAPLGMGENCLAHADGSSATSISPVAETAQAAPQASGPRWWVIILSVTVVAGALGIMLWRFVFFAKKAVTPYDPLEPLGAGPSTPGVQARIAAGHFWQHDKLLIAICSAIITAAIVAGAVFAAEAKPEFEAETATLAGGAKVVQDTRASGGEYVVFETNPPGTSGVVGGTTNQTGGESTNGGGTQNSGGNTDPGGGGDEGNGGGGGDSTPAGQCPAFPAFPDDNCTGWQHTGVTLQTCTEGDGDEGDGHLELANATYDGCDFANGAVVHSANVTIKRSRIQGVVSAHWSTDYDFQNLTLIDVEIIAATASEIAAKNIVNNGGGSAMNGANVTCIRCRIHYVPTGISLGNGSTIRDSYISDVTWGPGAHQAAIGAGGNSGHNSAIIHNRLDCSRWNVNAPGFQQGCSSALSLYDEPTLNNVLVQNNLFDTAGGYCTYGGGPQGTNIRYLDNRFGKKYNSTCGLFGAVSAFYSGNSGNVWTGNAWLDGSGSVNP